MVGFIDAHREAYGVELICAVLPIAPSTYYLQKARQADPTRLPARTRRDGALRPEITRVWEDTSLDPAGLEPAPVAANPDLQPDRDGQPRSVRHQVLHLYRAPLSAALDSTAARSPHRAAAPFAPAVGPYRRPR